MAKKLESTLLNMILSLVLISMTMSAALGFVYLKTKDPIEIAAKQNEIKAIEQAVPEFDSDPLSNVTERDGLVIYTLSLKNDIVGYAIKTFTDKGFSGHIEIMAGFTAQGNIHNVIVLNHKETPGLGTKMSDPGFSSQFVGKNPVEYELKVKKDDGDVDAITAATISSRAYCDALDKAFNTLTAIKDSITVN